jgi:DNA-binding NarL/FixJ family response regulator
VLLTINFNQHKFCFAHNPLLSMQVKSGQESPVRVVLADDHHIFRASLRHLLSVPAAVLEDVYGVKVGNGFRVVGEAANGEEMLGVVQSTEPDLMLLDPCLPRMAGLEMLRELGPYCDHLRTILLATTVNKTQLLSAVQFGIQGIILKDATTELLFEAIGCVMAGRCWLGQTLVTELVEAMRPVIRTAKAGANLSAGLTAREREVLGKVVAGYSNKEIATECGVSEETIKHHLTRMFAKAGAANRLDLTVKATQQGFQPSM